MAIMKLFTVSLSKIIIIIIIIIKSCFSESLQAYSSLLKHNCMGMYFLLLMYLKQLGIIVLLVSHTYLCEYLFN